MLKDELKCVLIIPENNGEKLLVDTNGERREMLSYGLRFIPLDKIFVFFERNFDMDYEKEQGSAFFIKTKCSDIIKEISELLEEVKR